MVSPIFHLVLTHLSNMDDHSRSGPATDFVVHVNCLSDAVQYGNTSSYFINDMKPPILLPYHTPYEVALSNIYFKQDFYQILKNDSDSAVQVVLYLTKKEPNEREAVSNDEPSDNTSDGLIDEVPENTRITLDESYNLRIVDQKIVDIISPSINLGDSITDVIAEYNKQAGTQLFEYDELNMKITPKLAASYLARLFTKHNLYPAWASPDRGEYLIAALKFGRVVGNYLGFYPNKPLFVEAEARLNFDVESRNSKVVKPFAGFGQEKVTPITNIFVYTNIVKRSRTGSQLSNLLEVVPFNTFSINNSITIYKELSQFDIHYIKIQLTDEYGKNIPFLDNTYVAVDLHFKPKI